MTPSPTSNPVDEDLLADEELPAARTRMIELAVSDLRAAPWNYKPPGTREQLDKLVESIKRDGSAGVLAVRWMPPGPGGAGFWEVIDGNHRLEAVLLTGWNTVFCEDFGKISLASAITIARRRNKQWYDEDTVLYAQLFAEIVVPEIGLDDLAAFMPDTRIELENILAEGEHRFGERQAPEPEIRPPGSGQEFVSLTVTMPAEAMPVYQNIYEQIARALIAAGTPLHPEAALAHGQVLELLAADALLGGMGGLLDTAD